MKALFSGHISPAKAAGLLAAALLAWPLFLFLGRQSKDEPGATPKRAVAPPSKLNAVGLADNVDWEGMPGFFAVWVDKLEWKNDRTQFAYWNPGSNSYSYFFEAIRTDGKYRFRSLSKKEAFAGKAFLGDGGGEYEATANLPTPEELKTLEFRGNSPTHPFLFFEKLEEPKPIEKTWYPTHTRPTPVSVPVKIEQEPVRPSDIEVKTISKTDDPGKK